MSILSGYKKVKNYVETGSGKKLISRWTSSNTVECDDGETVQTKVGAIKGITTSTSVTETGYAADATTVAALNQSLGIKSSDYTGTNNYIEYNNGLIIQWGSAIATYRNAQVALNVLTFKKQFTTTPFVIAQVIDSQNALSTLTLNVKTYGIETTKFTFAVHDSTGGTKTTTERTINWIAIGH